MPAAFTLFTARFQSFLPAMGTPVQAANGKPRWPLKYDLTLAAPEVYPAWVLVRTLNDDEPQFRVRYRAGLDEVGVDKLASRFRALATAGGDERLVLLCYEDLSKEGWWCHRRMFAQWWQDQTGDEVRELGPIAPPASEPTLFD